MATKAARAGISEAEGEPAAVALAKASTESKMVTATSARARLFRHLRPAVTVPDPARGFAQSRAQGGGREKLDRPLDAKAAFLRRHSGKVLSPQRSPTSLSWVRWPMEISFARHQFPPDIIRHAVWLYLRFTLSFRDVEDLLAERGLDVSYETVRRWVLKFGPLFAKELRRRRHRPTSHWHLDEMAVLIAGRRCWWRAVDDEGEVLDLLVQRRRDKTAAVKLMRKLLKKHGFAPGPAHGEPSISVRTSLRHKKAAGRSPVLMEWMPPPGHRNVPRRRCLSHPAERRGHP